MQCPGATVGGVRLEHVLFFWCIVYRRQLDGGNDQGNGRIGGNQVLWHNYTVTAR